LLQPRITRARIVSPSSKDVIKIVKSISNGDKGTVMLSIYVEDIILYASSPELMK
jgi:hypothetical protein